MNILKVDGVDQISKGDLLLLEKDDGITFPITVSEVINQGREGEEILISKKRNLYFIMSMYLDGTSWIKDCKIVQDGKMYSITNNMRDWIA